MFARLSLHMNYQVGKLLVILETNDLAAVATTSCFKDVKTLAAKANVSAAASTDRCSRPVFCMWPEISS